MKRRGQSTLEYVLVLTAIIAAIIVAANSFIKPRVENSLNHVTSQMDLEVHKIDIGGSANTTP